MPNEIPENVKEAMKVIVEYAKIDGDFLGEHRSIAVTALEIAAEQANDIATG